jgi:hypothetical protein
MPHGTPVPDVTHGAVHRLEHVIAIGIRDGDQGHGEDAGGSVTMARLVAVVLHALLSTDPLGNTRRRPSASPAA